jgi:hypothetical protein
MLLNDLLKEIECYLTRRNELMLVYTVWLELHCLNSLQKINSFEILEEIQLHLINQGDELEWAKKKNFTIVVFSFVQLKINLQLNFFWIKRNLHAALYVENRIISKFWAPRNQWIVS